MNRLNLMLASKKADGYRLDLKKDKLQGMCMDSSRTKGMPKILIALSYGLTNIFPKEARNNEISEVAYPKCDMKIKRSTIMLMKRISKEGMNYQS